MPPLSPRLTAPWPIYARGNIDVLVTCPISKDAIHGEEFAFPGHTEYLEDRLGQGSAKAMMIMAGEELRVALVTIHEPLSGVASKGDQRGCGRLYHAV